MASKDLVSEEVLQELIVKLEEIVNNYCWNLESFTDEEINSLFQASDHEVTYYNSLINDNIESKNFLWSSKKIAENIAESIISANEYTNNLIKNMSSIQLEWCETDLPSIGEANKIYILPVNNGTDTVNTLNIWNSTTYEFISIGNLEIDLTNYYTKTETDEKLELKANADEVISNDKIVQTLDSDTNSADTILSTNGLQVELDKKVDKDNIVNELNTSSTDEQIPSAKAVYESTIRHIADYTDDDADGLDFNNLIEEGFYTFGINSAIANSPVGRTLTYGNLKVTRYKNKGGYFISQEYTLIEKGVTTLYVRSYVQQTDTWRDWYKVSATTRVPDVSFTPITFKDSNIVSLGNSGYCVDNGWCHLVLEIQFNADISFGWTGITNCKIPIPKTSYRTTKMVLNSTTTPVKSIICAPQGELVLYGFASNTEQYFGSISYPVADDWRP